MSHATMQALRLMVAGPVTSFRHPHFLHGVQPSYDMPPPATLYGHICSALGTRIAPDACRIAFHFTSAGRWLDYEHTHLFGGNKPKLSPFERELLFQPRLLLYIDRPDWVEYFRYPRYPVTLGRSQDLMVYEHVDVVTLYPAVDTYISQTILPRDDADDLHQQVTLTLPRYVDADRRPNWARYAQVGIPQPYDRPAWVDPDQPRWRDRMRVVYWLSFI